MSLAEKNGGVGDRQPDFRYGAVNVPESEFVEANVYLRTLKSDFNIHSIYYPGCGDDTMLEHVFSTDEIVYMDNSDKSLGRRGKRFVVGDHDAIPFRDGVFDAIYYCDCHANGQQFLEMLRALRVGGIVIRDEFVCTDEISHEQIASVSGLVEIDYYLQTKIDDYPLHLFQKVQETPDPKNNYLPTSDVGPRNISKPFWKFWNIAGKKTKSK